MLSSTFPARRRRRKRKECRKWRFKTFENVLKRDPNNVNAIAGLASIYQSRLNKNFKKSHDYYMKYAQLDSNNPVPFYAIGSVDWSSSSTRTIPFPKEEQIKLIDEGLANLDKALALNPDYDDAHDL